MPDHAMQQESDDDQGRPPLRLERLVLWLSIGLAFVFAALVGLTVTVVVFNQHAITDNENRVDKLACTVVAFFKPGQSELIDALSRQYHCTDHPVPLSQLLPSSTTTRTREVPGPVRMATATRTATATAHSTATVSVLQPTPGPTVTRTTTRKVPGPVRTATRTRTITATVTVSACPPHRLCIPLL